LTVLTVSGVIALFSLNDAKGVRFGLIGASIMGVLIPILWIAQIRYAIPWMLAIGIFAGLGLWALTGRGNTASQMSLMVFLAALGALGILRPIDPYRIIFPTDTDYALAARTLEQQLKGNDRWLSYPYYFSNPLYRYADLPEPGWPATDAELVKSISEGRASGGHTFLWWSGATGGVMDGESGASLLADADRTWRFPNRFVLARFPPFSSSDPMAGARQ
jgi:hypothetical protein